MPRVPYQPYPERGPADLPMPMYHIPVSANMFGAQVGSALQSFGADMDKVAGEFEKIQKMESENKVDNAVTNNDLTTSQRTEDFLMLPGDQAKEALPGHVKGLVDDRDTQMKDMSNYEQHLFRTQTRGNLNRAIIRSTVHSAAAYRKFTMDQIQANVNSTIDEVVKDKNPDAFDQGMKRIADLYGKLGGVEGEVPEITQDKLKTRMGSAIRSVTEAIAKNNPSRAMDILERNKGSMWEKDYQRALEYVRGKDADRKADMFVNGLTDETFPSMVPLPRPRPTEEPEKRSEIEPSSELYDHALNSYAEHIELASFVGGRRRASLEQSGRGTEALAPKERSATLGGYKEEIEREEPMSRTGAFSLENRKANARVKTEGLSQPFRTRLEKVLKDAEAATGSKAVITSGSRTREEQAYLYRRYKSGQGGLAAPPGMSRHEGGNAVDLKYGPVLSKLWEWKRSGKLADYGVEFLKGKTFSRDRVHLQMMGTGRTRTRRAGLEDASDEDTG